MTVTVWPKKKPPKRETAAEFYARNAALGRTVRFKASFDMQYVPEEFRGPLGTKYGAFAIGRGTLTPHQFGRILAIITDDTLPKEIIADGPLPKKKRKTKRG